jgi:hypothetical protein
MMLEREVKICFLAFFVVFVSFLLKKKNHISRYLNFLELYLSNLFSSLFCFFFSPVSVKPELVGLEAILHDKELYPRFLSFLNDQWDIENVLYLQKVCGVKNNQTK